MLWAPPLCEVAQRSHQRVPSEHRQLLVVLDVLFAQRHLTLRTCLDSQDVFLWAVVAVHTFCLLFLGRKCQILTWRMMYCSHAEWFTLFKTGKQILKSASSGYPGPPAQPEVLCYPGQRVALLHCNNLTKMLPTVWALEGDVWVWGVSHQAFQAGHTHAVSTGQLPRILEYVPAHWTHEHLHHPAFLCIFHPWISEKKK